MNRDNTIANSRESFSLSRFGVPIFAGALGVGLALLFLNASPFAFLLVLGCAAAVAALLLYPEFVLALYVVVGDVKGDDRIASLGFLDLTLAVGAILLAGIGLNMLRKKRVLPLPPVFFLYIALIAMMAASLAYTPVLDAGLEKLGRFLTVTGIVIVAPFFLLGTPRAMKCFLMGYGVSAFAICCYSLKELGGSGRLVTPSNFTIGLGHIACALMLLIWFGFMTRLSFVKRIFLYPVLAVPAVALVGSGSRGPLIALVLLLLLSLFFYRRLLLDAACLLGLGMIAFSLVHIPETSLNYLATLVQSRSAVALLSFRGELMDHAIQLIERHPLLGVGIQGYRYHSPNAALYNWPHNIFLEIACELGMLAAFISCTIFASAACESFRQLKDRLAPYLVFSELAAALVFAGIVNAMNTGDINSDRSTWLFISLVFVVGSLRRQALEPARLTAHGNSNP
jgi:O-antigen ligase